MEEDGEMCLFIDTSPDPRIEKLSCKAESDYFWDDDAGHDQSYEMEKSVDQKCEQVPDQDLINGDTDPYSPTGFSDSDSSDFFRAYVADSELDIKNAPLEDDEDMKPSYETRSSSWWWERYAELVSKNKDLDEVAESVYEERKAICSDEKKNFFYHRQIARELVGLLRDQAVSFRWRYSMYKLCIHLTHLSKFRDQQQGKVRNYRKLEVETTNNNVKEDYEIGGMRVKMEEETISAMKLEMKKEMNSELMDINNN